MMLRAGVVACVGACLAAAPAIAQPRVKVDGDVTALSFSADGAWLAVGHAPGGSAGAVTVWSMTSRHQPPIALPRLGKPTRFVGFVGGAWVAGADDDALVVWELPEGSEVYRLDLAKRRDKAPGGVRLLADPRGPRIAVIGLDAGGDGTAEVLQVPGGARLTSISKIRVEHQAAWSADGGLLLLDGAAWSWDDLRSWRPARPGLAAVDAGGKLLASVDPSVCDGISLMDLAGRRVLRTVSPAAGGCPAALWVLDGGRSLLWIGGLPGKGQDLWRWDADRDRVRALRRGVAHHPAATLSPDEKLLAMPDGSGVRFYSTR